MNIVEPGKQIVAAFKWKNKGPVAYSPQMRLNLRSSDFGATWNEGSWVRSPQAAPGQSVALEVANTVPAGWDGKTIDVLVEVQDGGKAILEQHDKLFNALKQRWAWPKSPARLLEWANPEHTLVKAVGAPMHRGGAMRIWWGFGIYPVDFDAEWNTVPVYDPNTMLLGSDIWAGVWEDWGDDESWLTAPLQNIYKQFPGGYTSGLYAALWIMQSESPIDRRNAGLPPITREFGDESVAWDLEHVLVVD